METSDGTVILEARLGTIPYMAVWMLLLYTILAFLGERGFGAV
jgi:hypothetical protein